MRKYRSVLLLPLLLMLGGVLFSNRAEATHAAGGELLYEWVSDSTYKLIFKFYRDCAGSAGEPTTVTVCYSNSCNALSGNVILSKIPAPNGDEVGTGCPGYPTKCSSTSNTLPGYREWVYAGNVTLPSRCNSWRFYTGISARNNAITNLVNPGGQVLYIEATLNNQVAQGNSSPYFTVKPVPYVCLNSPYTFNNGAADMNGDMMRFESIRPRNGPTGCTASPVVNDIAYAGGYSLPDNPFATGNTFSLDSQTGQLSFTPTAVQIAVITVRVKEYRNGVEIGSVMRDIQIIVRSDCSAPPQVAEPDGGSVVNGEFIGNRFEGCANTPLGFCVDLRSPMDTASVLVVNDNHALSLPGAVLNYQNQGTDSVRACITWSPGMQDTGLHVLFFTVKDSTCRPPGLLMSQTFTIPVYIWPPAEVLRDTAICPGDSVQLYGRGWPSFTWNVLPGGSPLGSLSCTNCNNPMARPGQTTRYVMTADNQICAKSRDTATITVLPAPVITVTPDTSTCVNNELQLKVDVSSTPGSGGYQVAWTPNSFINDNTSATPVVTPPDDIIYHVKVTMDNGGCSAYDSVSVIVIKGFELENPDTAICLGQSVQIRANGDTRYRYLWTPSKGVSNTGIIDPLITPDSSRSYMITATYPGCRDSVRALFIDVQPNPVVDLGPDMILCYGDTFRIPTEVTPPDYPFYTYTWNPAGGLDTPSVRNPLFVDFATTTLTVTVSTPAGCVGTDDILINVVAPDIITASSDTLICPGDTIQLHVWGSQVSQVWRPGYYIDDTLSADPYVYPVTSAAYTVYGRDIDNCLDTQVVRVRVLEAAVVELPDSARIYPGESYQMNPGGNCLYFEWFPPLGLTDHRIMNPVATPEVNTRYFVTGRTEHGCIGRDSMDLYVNLDSYIDVPNAFVPGSGPTGYLKPVRRGNVTLKNFAVYNRWGGKMFETKNPDEGWDGKYNDLPQPMGVYVYIAEAVTPAGRIFYKQGNVTLLR